MKIQLTFKTPDVVDDTLVDLTSEEVALAKKVISKFVKYDEYVTIEIDTETQTAEVLEVEKRR